MCLQRKTICDKCGKDTDGLMTCFYPDGTDIHLCPDCLEKDGRFCFRCGDFSACDLSFEIIHPSYCDECWDEIQSDFWEDENESFWEYEPDEL